MAIHTNMPRIPVRRAPLTGPVVTAFEVSFANLLISLRKYILPHFAAAIGVFMLSAYVTSFTLFFGWHSAWKWAAIVLLVLFYALCALGYSLVTTAILAVRIACVYWGEFIEEVLDRVQSYAAEKAAQLPAGLSRQQAKTVLRASIHETIAGFRPSQTGLARAVFLLIAGATAIAVRAVLFSKISKWSGRTVQLGKLFAGKATLAGAVFLNLRFFSTLCLIVCYIIGGLVLVLNIYFVILLKYIV